MATGAAPDPPDGEEDEQIGDTGEETQTEDSFGEGTLRDNSLQLDSGQTRTAVPPITTTPSVRSSGTRQTAMTLERPMNLMREMPKGLEKNEVIFRPGIKGQDFKSEY
jgi:hypothetical protein